ncbi:TIGR02646 family protein [Azospirillaceae bacterium]
MKWIRGLESSPSGLKAFVDEHPQEREWSVFRDHNGGASLGELMDSLVCAQHGLCCYCEIDLVEGDRQVEHYHPKSDKNSQLNHTTDYHNLMAACCGGTQKNIWGPQTQSLDEDRYKEPVRKNQSCGQAKGEHKPDAPGEIILDPRMFPKMPSIVYVSSLEGEMKVNKVACQQYSFDPKQVEETIKLLGLNCPRLKGARKKRWKNLEEVTKDKVKDSNFLRKFAHKELQLKEGGRLQRFFTTTRTFFGREAERVLAENAEWM